MYICMYVCRCAKGFKIDRPTSAAEISLCNFAVARVLRDADARYANSPNDSCPNPYQVSPKHTWPDAKKRQSLRRTQPNNSRFTKAIH
jgi:hypothetical protein